MTKALFCVVVLAGLSLISDAAARSPLRSLQAFPQPLPEPFAFPKTIGDAARASRGSPDRLANSMCGSFANKDLQGSREFRDLNGAKIFNMMLNFAKAGYLYPDLNGELGAVLAKCNEMGGLAAEGVGYGMAYVFSKGSVQAFGMVAALEAAYAKTGSCKSVDKILDVSAAVIRSRDVALDELHLVMQTYSPKLAACTPRDAQQQFKAYSLKGDQSSVKARRAGGGVPQDPPEAETAAAKGPVPPPAPAPGSAPWPKEQGPTPHDPKHEMLKDLIPNLDPTVYLEQQGKEHDKKVNARPIGSDPDRYGN